MSEFITINGNPLYVEALGPEGAPAMIVHHGAPGLGSHVEPKTAFGPLADRMRVIVFDARGSGRSGLQGPFTHEQWAADVDGLREHFGLERIVMAGGSYGGFIALEYAIRYPERVRALILRDTAPDASFEERSMRNAMDSPRVQVDRERLERMFAGRVRDDADFEELWRDILPLYDYDYDPAKAREKADTTIYHHATHNVAFSQNLPGYDVKPKLGGITCPTLVIVGRHDWITPVEASRLIAEGIPGARLEVFERSGHSPQLEEPEKFQRLVREFLAEHGIISPDRGGTATG